MQFIFDTETSGLPRNCKYGKFPDYKRIEDYDTARIVSISWIVCKGDDVVQQAYYVVKPDSFEIGEESTKIHGITNEYASQHGVSIHKVFEEIEPWISCCTNFIGHNVGFDKNVLLSELYRYEKHSLLSKLRDKHFICTMRKGKEFMNFHKNPKLSELYEFLYHEPMENAHNAEADTYYCYKAYIKMFPSNKHLFFFRNREVCLTEEQKPIVFEALDTHMMVLACAGSGKTITSLCRIKYLIDNGVSESSIILTTFTKDAATDMKHKLIDIMGYTPKLIVGTIDSIAKAYTSKYLGSTSELKHVGEYGYDFLKLIRNQPSLISGIKYLFVDEYQDINDLQFQIIQEFYKNGCTLFAVGDDAQNIYTFRGSSVKYIMTFEECFKSSSTQIKTFKLTYNFRSTPPIVEFANAVIENNLNQIPKQMVSANVEYKSQEWPKPLVRFIHHQEHQSAYICDRIKELQKKGVRLDEIAILSSTNMPLFKVEEYLTKNNIKLALLDGKGDVRTNRKTDHVCLSTIHKSKGLEWDYVIMISMNDDIFPMCKTPGAIDEGRRLFYVGSTRARKCLTILFSKGSQTKYVTRYVSELPRSLFNSQDCTVDHMGKSEVDVVSLQKSVSKLLELLDGEDYVRLKQENITPVIDAHTVTKVKLYDAVTYTGIVKDEELYSDFGIFIDTLITREAEQRFNLQRKTFHKYAMLSLAHIVVSMEEFMIYKLYKNNFEENIAKLNNIDSVDGKDGFIARLLERNCKRIETTHLRVLMSIVHRLIVNSQTYNIPIEKIPIFTEKFLPNGFDKKIEDSMKLSCSDKMTYKDVIDNIWDVSKCQMIVNDRRRRLLFKQISGQDLLNENVKMIENLGKFLDKIEERQQPVQCRLDVRIDEGIYGEIDMIVGDTIVDYKTSNSDDIDATWVVQLLLYKVLVEKNSNLADRRQINHVGIFNPLRGWYYELDVKSWDKHMELVKYILKKRTTKLIGSLA